MAESTVKKPPTPEQANLREGNDIANCGKCAFWDQEAKYCNVLLVPTDQTQLCDYYQNIDQAENTGQSSDLMSQLFGNSYGGPTQ